MEAGEVDAVIKEPQHPYTRLLVDSIPWPNLDRRWGAQPIMARKSGASTVGCPFLPRCPAAMEICEKQPPLFQIKVHHTASCYLHAARPQVVPDRLSDLLPA